MGCNMINRISSPSFKRKHDYVLSYYNNMHRRLITGPYMHENRLVYMSKGVCVKGLWYTNPLLLVLLGNKNLITTASNDCLQYEYMKTSAYLKSNQSLLDVQQDQTSRRSYVCYRNRSASFDERLYHR